jgi:tape measure domain
MGILESSVKLYDGMTPVIKSIITTTNMLISTFETLNDETKTGIKSEDFTIMREEISKAQIALDSMENGIRNADTAQKQFNGSLNTGSGLAGGLTGKIGAMVGAFASIRTVQKVFEFSDEMSGINARLNMINDGSRTLAELQHDIYLSAQRSRGSYQATADTVAKLGMLAKDAFGSNAETIAFAEQLNKQFAISGTNANDAANVMRQITQALASGVLRGDELNSVFENATSVAQTIADYLGVSVGEVRQLASDGEITANIMKNAMLSAAEETNAVFAEMPMTWGQLWTVASNSIIMAVQPLLDKLAMGATWIIDNWEALAPTFTRVATAIGVAFAVWTTATMVQAGAQAILNGALLTSPMTWIIISVLAIIAIIYKVVDAMNKAKDTTVSATGIITGAIATAGAAIWNVVAGVINAILQALWNLIEPIISIVEWIYNAFNGGFNNIGDAFKSLLGSMLSGLISFAKIFTSIFDSIFGTDSTGWLNEKQKEVLSWGKNDNAVTLNREVFQLDRIEYGKAWDAGYSFGEGIENGIGDAFGGIGGSEWDGIYSDIGMISENTGDMADSLSLTNEELKYMRDIAERDAINRFATAEIHVDMNNVNQISSEMDIDGVVNTLSERLREEMEIAAEGVYT